jgi:hypothetical protein
VTLLPIVAAVVEGVGLGVMARGASYESAGDLENSRRLARLGGYVALAGSIAFAAAAGSIAPACVAIASGAIAVLGGLSGKPRPSWWVATAVMTIAAVLALR